GNAEDARRIARELVERRLAACVNVVESIRSLYRWEEKVADDAEQLLLIKTLREKTAELREFLFSIHPYEVPEFVVLRVEEMSDAYGKWLRESV
ncbi:MAG TPA: divalent-cation tolerance protein CutA, partial [Thermoanaerobaculia bacterium]